MGACLLQVPATPVYATWDMSANQGATIVTSLPPCASPGSAGVVAPADSPPPGQADDPGGTGSGSGGGGGGSGNTAVIAGVVAGTVGALGEPPSEW